MVSLFICLVFLDIVALNEGISSINYLRNFSINNGYFKSVAGNVVLTSTVEEDGRQFACKGEVVTFTCQIIRSFSIQWVSPLISQISFTSDPVNTTTSMPPFTATLTSTAGIGVNRNFTSTLQVTALSSSGRSNTTVTCRNMLRVNESSIFTVAGM